MNKRSTGFLLMIAGIALMLVSKFGGIADREARKYSGGDFSGARKTEHNLMYFGIGLFVVGGIITAIQMNDKK